MRFRLNPAVRNTVMPAAFAVGLLTLGSHLVFSETLVAPPSSSALQQATPATPPLGTAPKAGADGQALPSAAIEARPQTRIVVVEWKIKKGHEQEFLDYWSQKSTIPDRSGLIAEFLSGEESRERFPWINWAAAESDDATIFYNVGIWRQADDFMGQIGKYIDNNRPPMAFEADHRHRVFLAPLKWRVGMSQLPGKDADGVK